MYSVLKGRNFDTCYNIDGPWGHYAKWEISHTTKGWISYDSFHSDGVPWVGKYIKTKSRNLE